MSLTPRSSRRRIDMKRILTGVALVLFGIVIGHSVASVSATSDPETFALRKQVADLDRRLSSLESAVRVRAGQVTIQSGTISLEAPVIDIKASGTLTMKGARIQQN